MVLSSIQSPADEATVPRSSGRTVLEIPAKRKINLAAPGSCPVNGTDPCVAAVRSAGRQASRSWLAPLDEGLHRAAISDYLVRVNLSVRTRERSCDRALGLVQTMTQLLGQPCVTVGHILKYAFARARVRGVQDDS